MKPENNDQSSEDASDLSESVNFSHVTAVAAQWMLDFMFVSLCRRFKEGKVRKFDETLSTFEAMSESESLKAHLHDEKLRICAFLSRVMHGKELDVQFEDDERVTPLMSAAKIWLDMEQSVADKSLFNTISNLLVVQSVAVCLVQGETSSASFALKWFENNEIPQMLTVKLTTIVTQGEAYHPFLTSFSFSRLMQTVQSYLDAYLEKNPSDYILKRATQKVQSSQNTESSEDVTIPDSPMSEETNKSAEHRKKGKTAVGRRIKQKLQSTRMTDLWKPKTCEKGGVSVRRFSENEVSEITEKKSLDTSQIPKRKKPPQKWTHEEDMNLKAGVKRHGLGKWSLILTDYDFEGRTGVMLKDRWRTLQKLSSQNTESSEEATIPDSPMSEETNKSTEDIKKGKTAVGRRTKRKLLATRMTDLWKPETCEKGVVSVRRFSGETSADTSQIPQKRKKPPQKWTKQQDRNLKAGVKRHGLGKWSLILMDHDFEGRTGVMLKDRWRTLQNHFEVD